VGGSKTPKKLKKCLRLTRNFQRAGGGEQGRGGLRKQIRSLGEVWIFSGNTHYSG